MDLVDNYAEVVRANPELEQRYVFRNNYFQFSHLQLQKTLKCGYFIEKIFEAGLEFGNQTSPKVQM